MPYALNGYGKCINIDHLHGSMGVVFSVSWAMRGCRGKADIGGWGINASWLLVHWPLKDAVPLCP